MDEVLLFYLKEYFNERQSIRCQKGITGKPFVQSEFIEEREIFAYGRQTNYKDLVSSLRNNFSILLLRYLEFPVVKRAPLHCILR